MEVDSEEKYLLQDSNGPRKSDFNIDGKGDVVFVGQNATTLDRFLRNGKKFDPHTAAVESLDFEVCENLVYRADQASKNMLTNFCHSSMKWIICFIVGVLTAFTAFAVNMGVENIAGIKFSLTLSAMNDSYFASYLIYMLCNCILVMMSAAIVVFFGPAAAGSGIPDIKAYLNGIDIPGILLPRTLIAKVVGSLGSVSGGLAVGKEGPFVHTGSCIASILSSVTGKYNKKLGFHSDKDRQDIIVCGAAGGVAAAFRAPVGGVLFALEEATSWWNNPQLWITFFTTAVVSLTIRLLMKLCQGSSCGFFGSGGFIIFEISEAQTTYELYELLPVLLLGVVGGLLGSAFNGLNAKLCQWRRDGLHPRGRRIKIIEAVFIACLTSTIQFCLPLFFSCQACPQTGDDSQLCPRQDNSHSGNYVSFNCPDQSSYNDLATIFFSTQDDAIRNLFSSQTAKMYSVQSLLVFFIFFYFLSILTYGVSVPSGLFVPCILCGASYGRLVGMFVVDMHPQHQIDEATYALLGAASFLGGAMRMTVSLCVIVLELTNNLTLLPLIMLVLLVSKAVGDGIGVKAIYDIHVDMKGLPFLDPQPEKFMRHITAKEACSRPPLALKRVMRVGDIVELLVNTYHNGFPVLNVTEGDNNQIFLGVILRHQLLVLLRDRKSFQSNMAITERSNRAAFLYDPSDFGKPQKDLNINKVQSQLTRDQMEMYIDLAPYVNPPGFVVQEDASVSKVYTLFRTLGLRHVCVIPRADSVVGIITRKDLLPSTLEATFGDESGRLVGIKFDNSADSSMHNGVQITEEDRGQGNDHIGLQRHGQSRQRQNQRDVDKHMG